MSRTILPKVPGIQFFKIQPYQHRRQEHHSNGYSGTISESGQVRLHKRYYTTVKVSRAWRIGFKNMGNAPVDVVMYFSVHDKFGKQGYFAETYRNLRPGEPAELSVQEHDKKSNLMFELVEVHVNGQLHSATDVKQWMPRMSWGMKSWAVALLMAIISALALTDPQPMNVGSLMLPLLALTAMGAGFLHRTPVLLMLITLLIVPFTSHTSGVQFTIMVIGLIYLYFVWKKRHSVKDFLMGSATPEN